ncbi:DUF5316 domain-containing protein [Aquibacillus koreensis]|uniref:DUF5316 domain-containing protein n=1 Tax=Aquibacillus koreensis TaxID=279446 RepID=A0A9X4ALI1_9BACI|nr:DUF5316 domain-containing protein [Aquibacillus koreensis]MCT2535333.1 DUF5316 domain-containing protein [Aquibacillus koreensis]MDC3422498.1 DUF5316 domain-containing protein [Aquibacillus koreensis]
MLRYLGIGLLITLVAVVIGFVTGEWNLVVKIIGGAALVPLLLSGLATGAFVNGDRARANYHTETKEDRQQRNKWVGRLLLISIPNVVIFIALIGSGLLASL